MSLYPNPCIGINQSPCQRRRISLLPPVTQPNLHIERAALPCNVFEQKDITYLKPHLPKGHAPFNVGTFPVPWSCLGVDQRRFPAPANQDPSALQLAKKSPDKTKTAHRQRTGATRARSLLPGNVQHRGCHNVRGLTTAGIHVIGATSVRRVFPEVGTLRGPRHVLSRAC